MKPTAGSRWSVLAERLTRPAVQIWGTILAGVLICLLIAAMYREHRRTLEEQFRSIREFRQARLDLAMGLSHLDFSPTPDAPYDRAQGFALMRQAVREIEDGVRSHPGVWNEELATRLNRFRDSLDRWSAAPAQDARLLTEIRLGLQTMEALASRVDAEVEEDIRAVERRQDEQFHRVMAGAGLALALILGLVGLAGRSARRAAAAARQTRDELGESEERFRAMVDNAFDAVFLFAPDGTLEDVNGMACESLGMTRAELRGLRVQDFNPAITPEQIQEMMARIDRGEDFAGETVHRRRDGTTFPVEVRSRRLMIGGERFGIAVARDISLAQQAQRALREERDRSALMLGRMPVGCVTNTPDLKITYWNPAAERIFGFRAEEVLGKTPYETIIPPSATTEVHRALQQVAGGQRNVVINENLTKDGRIIVCEWTNTPLTDAQGAHVGYLAMVQDITDRIRAEEALRESEEQFRATFEQAAVGMAHIGFDGRFLRVNRRFAEIVGREPGELRRVGMRDLTSEEGRRAVRESGEQLLRGEESIVRREDAFRQPGGGTVWVQWTVSLRRDGDGRPLYFICVIEDVTRRRLAADALAESESRYRELLDSIDEGYVVLDPVLDERGEIRDWQYVEVNPSFSRQSGLGDPVGRTIREMIPGLESHWVDRYGGVLRTGQPMRFLDGIPQLHRWFDVFVSRVGGAGCQRLALLFRDVTESRNALLELREREQRLRLLGDNLPDGMMFQMAMGPGEPPTFRYVSHGVERLLGIRAEEILRDPMLMARAVHPDDRAALERAWEGAFAEGVAIDHQHRRRHRDGSWRWLHLRASTRRLPDGTVVQDGIVLDVTARKRVEEQLASSEARFRAMAEGLADPLFLHDRLGRIEFVNAAAARSLGYPAEALCGMNVIQVDARFAPLEAERSWEEALRAGGGVGNAFPSFESAHRRADGTTFPVEVRIAVIDWQGEPRFLATARDLTEVKRLDRQLRYQEMLLREAAELAHVGGWNFDPLTRRMEWTEEAAEIHQVPHPASGDLDWATALYEPGDRERLAAAVVDAATHGTPFDMELRVRTPQGRKWVRSICRPILQGGEVVMVRGSVQDISDRKLLEDQFRQSQKMEAIGRLAGGVAHDFNNLLTVINGYCDLMLMELVDHPHLAESVHAVREAGERAAGLTSQLLAFSRKAMITPRVLDLNGGVRASEKLLRRLIGEDVALSVDCDPEPCRVMADPNQIDQVILNLAVNARDAMPGGGRLSIQTRLRSLEQPVGMAWAGFIPGRYVELSVGDSGSGMPEEVKARIFEPFFTTKGQGKGTGLGLAVVHGVVQQAGGGIAVESRTGQGTIFRLYFPEATEPTPDHRPASADARTQGTETILLVEDEDSVRSLCKLALEGAGYTVLTAADGSEALRRAQSAARPVDLLVTDVVMPGMSGRQLLETLRASSRGLRVLFVSGYTDDAMLLHGIRHGSDAFLQKPFPPQRLAHKVRELLDRPVIH